MKKTHIFDLDVSFGEYDDFVNNFIDQASNKNSEYHVFTNSHMLYETKKSSEFFNIVSNASTICPDGMPLTYSLRWIKKVEADRVAGNDMIFSLIDKAYKNNLKIFFYGSTQDVLDKIKNRLDDEYNDELVSGYFSPPFKELSQEELDNHAEIINDFGANLVFVGLGCPKQERWMHAMKNKVKAPMFGVGGAFLLFAGVDTRAPKLMRDLGIEWVYRLVLEPKRLFVRYFVTNLYFCKLFISELFKTKK